MMEEEGLRHLGRNMPPTLQATIRRARRRRLFLSRHLVLCWASLVLLVVFFATQHASTNSMHGVNREEEDAGQAAGRAWDSSSSRTADDDDSGRTHTGSSTLDLRQPHHTLSQTDFALPPLHSAPVRRDEDDDASADEEHAHNPSLYGWTPDVYPDPLLNPIRCAIAYLPGTNLTDGLR
jgi:hypothetical protein